MPGWSNQIPNPFTVGGGGISGQIIIYNAAGAIVGQIDENGLIVYGDDASYAQLSPAIPVSGSAVAGLAIYPQFGDFWALNNPSWLYGEVDLLGVPVKP